MVGEKDDSNVDDILENLKNENDKEEKETAERHAKEAEEYEKTVVKQAGLKTVFGNKWMRIVAIGMSGLLATIWYVAIIVR